MSSAEFAEWIAFYNLEPFGEEWAQSGTVASIVANTARDPKKRRQPFEPWDFMPVDKKKVLPSQDQLLQKVVMLNAWLGGEDLRKQNGNPI